MIVLSIKYKVLGIRHSILGAIYIVLARLTNPFISFCTLIIDKKKLISGLSLRAYNLRLIILLNTSYLILNTSLSAQTCPPHEPAKKAKNLYEKGIDKKKHEKAERMKYLKEAIDEDPEFLDARYEYASQLAVTALFAKKDMSYLEPHFLKIVQTCPQYHSDPYYFLGEHYFNQKNYPKALEYLQQFVLFEDEDEKKFSRKYEEYLVEAKEDLEYARFYSETAKNPVPFNPVLVESISTNADEYLPLISPDNEFLYFTRKKLKEEKIKNGVVVQDGPATAANPVFIERFMESKKVDKTFDAGRPMAPPFNLEENNNYGGASITIDNKHLFLTICKPSKVGGRDYINCDLYTTDYTYGYNELTDKEEWFWTPLRNMGPHINGNDSWEGQPSISGDGKTLFFATARADSKGIDIYVTQRDNTGTWKPAISVGAPINTEFDDKSPFIHSDSQTLYFASKGHLGFGGYDLYYTRFEKGKWAMPKNLGTPINSAKDEHGFVLSTDGKKVFYGSDVNMEKGKGLDIFTFELYEAARPQKVLLLKGTVVDEHGNRPKKATVELKNTVTNEISTVKVDSIDGNYTAVVAVKDDEPLVLNVKEEGKVFSSTLISSKDMNESVKTIAPTTLETFDVGKPFRINDIYYATNSADMDPQSKLILNEFALYMLENPKIKIAIHGHTDNAGGETENLALSNERAYSVMEYLQQRNIDASRLSFKGFGESKPLVSNDTEAGRAKNRRTEFVILSK